jgi:hypothetical protein
MFTITHSLHLVTYVAVSTFSHALRTAYQFTAPIQHSTDFHVHSHSQSHTAHTHLRCSPMSTAHSHSQVHTAHIHSRCSLMSTAHSHAQSHTVHIHSRCSLMSAAHSHAQVHSTHIHSRRSLISTHRRRYIYRGPNASFPANPPPSRSVLLIAVGSADTDEEAKALIATFTALVIDNNAENASDWRVKVCVSHHHMCIVCVSSSRVCASHTQQHQQDHQLPSPPSVPHPEHHHC